MGRVSNTTLLVQAQCVKFNTIWCNYVAGGNIGELTAIRQYFTYQCFLTDLVSLLLNPNSSNISPPILGDKCIRQ